MKKLALLFLVFVLTIVTAACGTGSSSQPAGQTENNTTANNATEPGATELTIKHKLGETPVTKNPEKVVVFDFGVLDTLDKLGVEIAAVPQGGTIPIYLSKYEDSKYVNAGGLKEPDFETIAGLNPDLIIISDRQADLYEEFNKIAPTIHMGVDYTRYMDSYKENSITLGQIFNKEAEVEAELVKVDEAIKSLHEKATASGQNALIVLANAGNLSAYGPGSRFGLVHDVFGLKAVDENIEVSTHGQNISFEYIMEKDPDYLFVVDRDAVVGGDASAKQTIENELIKNTKAYKNGNIVYLDPNYWYLSGGGLVSVAGMVKAIEAAIQ
ncbi:siderophore ABC transporter substrate-binding protein [Schinkia azotoformans]|uniref:Periplasmic binding protein n=1 Tax=Schinkia azotoformans LMG 9581 TaxID=1131731 RepID=K6DD19_SCHAZ|nr:siderophore ABC transporter substrate-binding protein [Schinkia azotoformans]EKN66214.1 periplasmic binding protein [Schinkia azotoformans LMG 9581]MEC1640026.1 siderophore ABC transporter substrate-binding protein [Schinkia azotoformans]MEC1720031.1 siderophore ABC transporter substrate-binding protein [Schinkia azotoformans]MEC1947496.1 siderophore ABC transporter substrate-binding protein [Schinkia azotoformans]MED4354140.1 siderophore ABC transporter substrate-binding protein [Schinkia 